jgi:hypothetical protein
MIPEIDWRRSVSAGIVANESDRRHMATTMVNCFLVVDMSWVFNLSPPRMTQIKFFCYFPVLQCLHFTKLHHCYRFLNFLPPGHLFFYNYTHGRRPYNKNINNGEAPLLSPTPKAIRAQDHAMVSVCSHTRVHKIIKKSSYD